MARRTVLLQTAVVAAVLVVACAAVFLAVSEKAATAFPGNNDRIAFEGFRQTGSDGLTSEIITVRPDGTGMKQLTSVSGSVDPTFSPDGTKIAYGGYEDSEIYVMNRSGHHNIALTDNNRPEYGPAWSPDGTRIAFMRQVRVSTPDGGFELQVDVWLMNADGSEQKSITNDFAIEEDPTWSPDGSKIAFAKNGDIWTMNPDGSEQKNITNTGYVNGRYVAEYDPDFSPEGKKLAFASSRQYRKYDIYTMNLHGTALTNVTHSQHLNEEDCVWSPDGTKIAYRKDLKGNSEIYKKNADGSGRPKNVSNDPEYNESPDWGSLHLSHLEE